MPGGRPTDYSEEMLEKARDYVVNYEQCGDVVPTAAGMACELGIGKATLYVWAQKHPQFQDTLNELNAMQERRLTAGGLNGSYQPTIAKLMLANHGYHDKQEIGGSKDMGDIVIKVVESADD